MSGRGRILATLTGSLVAEAVNKVVPLLILRFVVARIGVEGFGFAQFGYWLIDFAVNFVVAGYAYVAAVELGQVDGDRPKIARIISEVTVLKLVHCVFAAVGLFLVLWLVPRYHAYAQVTTALSFVLVTTALDMSFVHVGTRRMLSLSILTIGVKLTSLVLIVLLVRAPGDLLTFALLYFGVNGLIGFGNFLINARRFGLVRPDLPALRRRFLAALPFALMVALTVALERYDVVFIEDLLGPAGAGLYGGPVRIVQAVGNVSVAIGQVFFSEVVAAKGSDALTGRAYLGLWSMLALLLPIAVGAWFVGGDLLTLILGEPFAGLGPVFAILLAALCAHSLVQVFGLQVLMVHKRAAAINGVLALAIAVGIGLSLALRQRLGMPGIALATFASRAVAALGMMALASAHLDRLPWRELARTFGPAAGMGLVLLLVRPPSFVLALAIGVAVYGVLMLAFNQARVQSVWLAIRERAR